MAPEQSAWVACLLKRKACNYLAALHREFEDELGYINSHLRYADLIFEVVTRRYEAEKPIILSTNKPFSEWPSVLAHAACVVTLVDRLIHLAEVIEIEAESYRLKEAKELSEARSKRRAAKKS